MVLHLLIPVLIGGGLSIFGLGSYFTWKRWARCFLSNVYYTDTVKIRHILITYSVKRNFGIGGRKMSQTLLNQVYPTQGKNRLPSNSTQFIASDNYKYQISTLPYIECQQLLIDSYGINLPQMSETNYVTLYLGEECIPFFTSDNPYLSDCLDTLLNQTS